MRLISFFASVPLLILAEGCASTKVGHDGTGGSASVTSANNTGATTSAETTGAGGSTCTPPSGPTTFEVGTGETCFDRLTELQTVTVNQGPQGGFHIWAAVGCTDCGLHPTVEYGIQDPATATWFPQSYPTQQVLDLSGAWPEKAGLTAFLPGVVYDPSTQLPKGTHVIVYLRVLAPDGSTLHEGGVEVVLGDVMQWNPPCDPDPMTCGLPGGQPCCSFDGG